MFSDQPIIKTIAWNSSRTPRFLAESEYVTSTGVPSVNYDLVEVVRCRDCKNFASDELGDYCTLLDFEDVKSMNDGFCAWGERRDA